MGGGRVGGERGWAERGGQLISNRSWVGRFEKVRWLATVTSLPCTFMKASKANYAFRRMQLNFQQTERQRKNILQQALVFHSRADELVKDSV